MRKAPIALAIVLILAAFAAADFYLNGLGKGVSLDFRGNVPAEIPGESPKPIPVDSMYKVGDVIEGFRVVSVVAANQIFEKIDLSSVKNIQVVKSVMQKEALLPEAKSDAAAFEGAVVAPEPITFYEIRGARDQGSLTYLSVKLQFVAQLNSLTENLNETNAYGDGSFYYNDLNNPETSFLLVQMGDNLYGFQASKKNESIPNFIKGLEKK